MSSCVTSGQKTYSWSGSLNFRSFISTYPATTVIYTLSLHDALPIYVFFSQVLDLVEEEVVPSWLRDDSKRSEEHTSELQSQSNLVCRLLLEKKKPRPARRLLRAAAIPAALHAAPYVGGSRPLL